MAYNRDSKEKFHEQLLKRKAHSVVCGCGHRVYINPRRGYAVCIFCGTKHISPKENFKKKLNSLLKANG